MGRRRGIEAEVMTAVFSTLGIMSDRFSMQVMGVVLLDPDEKVDCIESVIRPVA